MGFVNFRRAEKDLLRFNIFHRDFQLPFSLGLRCLLFLFFRNLCCVHCSVFLANHYAGVLERLFISAGGI